MKAGHASLLAVIVMLMFAMVSPRVVEAMDGLPVGVELTNTGSGSRGWVRIADDDGLESQTLTIEVRVTPRGPGYGGTTTTGGGASHRPGRTPRGCDSSEPAATRPRAGAAARRSSARGRARQADRRPRRGGRQGPGHVRDSDDQRQAADSQRGAKKGFIQTSMRNDHTGS